MKKPKLPISLARLLHPHGIKFLIACSCSAVGLSGCDTPSGAKTANTENPHNAKFETPKYAIWLTLKSGTAEIELSREDSLYPAEQFKIVKEAYSKKHDPPLTPKPLDNPIGLIMDIQTNHSFHELSKPPLLIENFRFWVMEDYLPLDFMRSVEFTDEFKNQFSEILKSKFKYHPSPKDEG